MKVLWHPHFIYAHLLDLASCNDKEWLGLRSFFSFVKIFARINLGNFFQWYDFLLFWKKTFFFSYTQHLFISQDIDIKIIKSFHKVSKNYYYFVANNAIHLTDYIWLLPTDLNDALNITQPIKKNKYLCFCEPWKTNTFVKFMAKNLLKM